MSEASSPTLAEPQEALRFCSRFCYFTVSGVGRTMLGFRTCGVLFVLQINEL